MKIGFFGGTFDPIHNGHLNLAIEILEKEKFDRIFFCPANVSPEKREAQSFAFAEHRYKMVALAIKPIANFSLLDLEIKRPGLSYTIETIRALKTQYPQEQLHLILGEDLLPGLENWKEIDTLLQLAPPLVGMRHLEIESKIKLSPALSSHLRFIRIPLLDISSTQLRIRLRERKYCGHLIPPKVLDYIEAKQLYY